ncbi:hypothetical protein, partial [Sulfuricurvum sp.]|uniref:hypothetical protein n=1 Tax=Sulfuricurvum sp. TaxID=2025608 RepID=UPI003BB53D24
MLDVKSLERRWFKYKLKSILPYFFAFLIISLISSAILLWLNYNPHTVQKQMLKQEKKVTIQKPIQQVSLTNTELNTTILEPSMEFVQSFQNTL